MEVKHKHVVDLTDRQTTVIMDAVQGDNGRILELEMLSAGEKWPLPEALAVKIRYQKPDGTGGIYDTLPDGTSAWSGEGNVLTVALAPEVCTAAGRVLLQIHLMQGQHQLTTFAMGLRVQPEVEAPQISGDYTNLSAWLETTGKKVLTEEDAARIEQLSETTAAFVETAAQVDATLEAMRKQAENGEFDGKSAYELAVKQGFDGTEEQWLASLVGPQGGKGEKGEKGDAGGIDTQFVAIYGVTTNAEIEAARQAGKEMLCVDSKGRYYPFSKSDNANHHEFIGFGSTMENVRLVCTNGVWTNGGARFISVYGDTMQGALTLKDDPTQPLHAATKQYVDNHAGGKGAKIVTGTYVSTNEAGEDHPCSLTFDFVPKLLILMSPCRPFAHHAIINLVSATEEFSSLNATMSNVDHDTSGTKDCYYPDTGMNSKVVGTTVYWYNSTRWQQFNFSNYTYAYMAIGDSASGSGGGVGDLDEISAALDRIIEIQNELIGGDGV